MSMPILTATVFEVNPEVPCCKDCGKPMSLFEQENSPRVGGLTIIATCWTQGCLLATVTLSVDQFATMNEVQYESYREMNRVRAAGFHATPAAVKAVNAS